MDYEKYREELQKIIDDSPEGYISDNELLRFTEYLNFTWSTADLKLYRYSPADYFNIRNFETGKLKLTNNGVLNDIYEGIPSDNCKEITPVQADDLSELAYIKSFSEDPYNVLMWSHYADEQRGFCVEYDLDMMECDNRLWAHLFPVVYSTKRKVRMNITVTGKELKQLRRNIEDNCERDDGGYLDDCKALFITKGDAWSYEKEWRIVFTKAEIYDIDDNELNHYVIPFDFASSIYLGFRINPTVKTNILEIVSRINEKRKNGILPRIKAYQIMLETDSYELRTKEIEYKIGNDGDVQIRN